MRSRKYREKERKFKKAFKSQLSQKGSELLGLTTKVTVQDLPGRPRLEDEQPELLETIARIAMFGASAADRRRHESLRSCKTLKDLHKELEGLGFEISKTATYYRLLYKNRSTVEGKRHVKTVPVKLCRAQSDVHKDHQDQQFCKNTIRDLEIIASILGPEKTAFISSDDKARVPIGLTAAKVQAPLLMHMEYRVGLPDHDFVIAGKHKLIPSVYAGVKIEENMMGDPSAVTYSGPTFIAIRSAKHASSTAATHGNDYHGLFNVAAFDNFLKMNDQHTKPVMIITSDGGPDENPRFPKVISQAISIFKTHDLDALFWATNAPSRSAFNRVERRMAPLSRELAGIILPHDKFGTHLNGSGKTVNLELEKNNFRFAGETLATIWENVIIDGYPVVAEYIDPDEQFEECWAPPNHEWYLQHVRESQYCLQVRRKFLLYNLYF